MLAWRHVSLYQRTLTTMLPARVDGISLPPLRNARQSLTTRRDSFLEVIKQRPCEEHGLTNCPACQPDDYMRRRVVKAVSGALKRLGLRKTLPVLTYLGADSWRQVIGHLAAKRESWNLSNPKTPMTLTNIALDHIRPVRMFQKQGDGAQIFLCNHYTNLQPLLHEDNNWKGDCWSVADEKYWHEHILLKPIHTEVYYPQAAPPQPSLMIHTRGK